MKLEREYIAGLLEGRGYIYELDNGAPRVQIRLHDRRILNMLKNEFGGTCYESYEDSGKFDWRIQGLNVYDFLSELLPHLKIEKNRVKKMLKNRWEPKKRAQSD
jgi:hypothetical protein